MIHASDKIIELFRDRKENIPLDLLGDFIHYNELFVQRRPKYGIKPITGGHWTTKNKPLSDSPVLAHLYGKYYTGCLARYYPAVACLDIDHKSHQFVGEIRSMLHMRSHNSVLIESQSPGSYHLFFIPTLNGKPLTIKKLHAVFKSFLKEHFIELYPQANRIFRLAFSPHQQILDVVGRSLAHWQDKLHLLDSLDEYDVSQVPGCQSSFDLEVETPSRIIGSLQDGFDLLGQKLYKTGTRSVIQYKILCTLVRSNVLQLDAEHIVWEWIQINHNGCSDDYNRSPKSVRAHIKRQAAWVYSHYINSNIYPDDTDILHNGWLIEPDVREIFMICEGNRPRSNLLYHTLKYYYPRKSRIWVSIHSDLYKLWGSKNFYSGYLDEYEIKGFFERSSAFCQYGFAKKVKFNWNFGSRDQAILYDGRPVDSLEDTVRFLYTPREFREILMVSGCERRTAIESVKSIFC